jgi:3-oxoacyl-[acyl-carrier protein] reductase
MTDGLAGMVAVVTGTAHGIGAEIADALGGEGAKVHRVDKDTVDLTVPDAVRELFAAVGAVGILQRRRGRIINVSLAAGLTVSKTGIQACTSAKAGQIGFTRQMAHELGPFRITVNCIAPGFIIVPKFTGLLCST